MTNRLIKISGTGKYLPQQQVLSSELDIKLGKEIGWVQHKSGVVHRHFANQEETTSFMAMQAAKQALAKAGLRPEQLDCIISACGVMEQAIPCTAVLVQKQLGLENSGIMAFDVNSTCLSFLSALDLAAYMLAARRFKHILIISSDIPSVGLNWNHMESCTIFGDGAAAMVISQSTEHSHTNILASHMETYSKGSSYCQIRSGGTRLAPSRSKEDAVNHAYFDMDGKAAYKLAAAHIDGFLKRLFADTNLTLSTIDWVIPHQASLLAMHHLRKKIKVPAEKFIDIFSTHGNQVAASMPTALHTVLTSGNIKQGDKLLLMGTSAGISLGGMIMEYQQ